MLKTIFEGVRFSEFSKWGLIKYFFMWFYARLVISRFFVEYKYVFLHEIESNHKFDLGAKDYDWDKLYRSILNNNGELDRKNHPPVGIIDLSVNGRSPAADFSAAKRGKCYRPIEGNHRIATLQFIHLHNKSKRIKVYHGSKKWIGALEGACFFEFRCNWTNYK